MSEDINFGKISEALNNKADRDLNNTDPVADYVVERYNDENRNWYEVWKSGWLRQGGKLSSGQIPSVTLLKPFASGAYTVISVAEAQFGRNYYAYNKTSTSFSCAQGYSNSSTIANFWDGENEWIAEGQGAK